MIGGRRETCQIANDPTAKGDDRGPAVATGGQQNVVDQVERLPVLVRFAIGQDDRRNANADFFERLDERG